MYHHIDEKFFTAIKEIALAAGLPRPYEAGVTYGAGMGSEALTRRPLGDGPGEPRLAVYRGLPGQGGMVGELLYGEVLRIAGGKNAAGAWPW